ncbi:hypothetical protein BurJ1DRAFT_4749 [Burkholderiales bacterium JOSHI_001]|nr:hypothetical protein BurJ1DRAFT_4749 [Burkholderiales bacterium JOSHI_001]
MPMPTVVQTRPPGTVRHVFISYSRDDVQPGGDLPGLFAQALRDLASKRPELGLADERIFFDRHRLMPGDVWGEAILQAVERSQLFVLLVSASSLKSTVCMQKELAVAAGRGIPIVPLLLEDCEWAGFAVPGDARGRKLGDFDAQPKNSQGRLQPVRTCADPAAVLAQTVAAIGERLQRDALDLGPAPGTPPRPMVSPLLAYHCNEEKIERQFDRGLMRWDSQALLVLARGRFDDNVPSFWDRLRLKNLSDIVDEREVQLLPERPLKWPAVLVDGKPGNPADVALDVAAALSDALTGKRFKLRDSAGLAAWLQAQSGVTPLIAVPKVEPAAALQAGLVALLDLIEATPPDTPLDRLVLAFSVEDPQLLEGPGVFKPEDLQRWQRTQVLALNPLEPLTREDVRKWWTEQSVQDHCALDDQALLARVFTDTDTLRLRHFDERVRPLLGLG